MGSAGKKLENKKIALIPLIFLIYFEVCAGPYAPEPAVHAAGALPTILGFSLFTLLWSVPQSLITAELCAAIPDDGGFIVWAERAFGPFVGGLMGVWKFFGAVINLSPYPPQLTDSLMDAFPSVLSRLPRPLVIVLVNFLLPLPIFAGLWLLGGLMVGLGVVSLLPYAVMGVVASTSGKVRVRRWFGVTKGRKDWIVFFSTIFWSVNYWDSISTMAGEIDNPASVLPRALLGSGLLVGVAYVVPFLAAIAVFSEPEKEAHLLNSAAVAVGGEWLKNWIEVGALINAVGLYQSQLSSAAFQLIGLADLGVLPRFFAIRSRTFNAPWPAIIASCLTTIPPALFNNDDTMNSGNLLYCLGMVLEFLAFIRLRRKQPALHRPFRIPLEGPGIAFMCSIPAGLIAFLIVVCTWKVYVISGALTMFGICMYLIMRFCKFRCYFEFCKAGGEREAGLTSRG